MALMVVISLSLSLFVIGPPLSIRRAPKRGEIKRGDFHELTLGYRESSHPAVATLASTKVVRWDGMSFKGSMISIWDWLQWSDLRALPRFVLIPGFKHDESNKSSLRA